MLYGMLFPVENNLKTQAQQCHSTGAQTRTGMEVQRFQLTRIDSWEMGKASRNLSFFISTSMFRYDMDGQLLSTYWTMDRVFSKSSCVLADLQPCNHPEADARIFVQWAQAEKEGHTAAYIRTVDDDTLALAVWHFITIGLTELWIGFGTGKKDHDIAIYHVSSCLGQATCLAFPLFHCPTGCDTTSYFLGYSKKSARTAWNCTPNLTETLVALTWSHPHKYKASCRELKTLLCLQCVQKGCNTAGENEARSQLFTTDWDLWRTYINRYSSKINPKD